MNPMLPDHPIADLNDLTPAELDQIIEDNLDQVMATWDEADPEFRRDGPMYCMIKQLDTIQKGRLLRKMRNLPVVVTPPVEKSAPTFQTVVSRKGTVVRLRKG